MKKTWCYLVIFGLALTLNACSNKPPATDTSKIQPCLVPNDLNNDAMGKLGIRIIQIGNSFRVILPSDAIFVINSGEIQESAYPGLDELAITLKKYKNIPMTVSAYTDELWAPAENKVIADQQAQSLVAFLWTRGFSHQNFTTVGVGEDESGTVASNRSIMGSAANRRVEITFRADPHYGF